MNPCIIYTWKKFHNAQMHPNFSNPQEVAGFDLLSGSPLSPSAATATNSSSKLTFSSYLASVSPPTFAAPSSRGTKVPVFCRGHATYKSPCRSVGPSVRPSHFAFFCIFGQFKGWKVCIRVCPCPNHHCPCPNHYCPCPNHYCPCPTARDRSSRVNGLV